MPSTFKAIDIVPSTSSVAEAARVALSTAYHYNNTILLPSLEERLHTPTAAFPISAATTTTTSDSSSVTSLLGSEINSSTGLTSISHVASVVVSNFLPLSTASLSPGADDSTSVDDTKYSASSYTSSISLSSSAGDALSASSSASASLPLSAASAFYPSYSPPVVESLVASSAEDFSNNFRDLSFDIFDDNDNDLFGSPMAFDASENGLWNGRFVPPPPRPPFFVDEPVLSDGLTTCDLCSWAMPTKSTFIFEGTMEKASELGWPLTLTIVSILSAILGAIIMIAVVKCKRKKTSHQRSDTHVQWWSRNKRPNSNNNHLRRSNIYTAHPVDSIRGLQQPQSLSASSSMTAMTTAMAAGTAPSTSAATLPFYHHGQHGMLNHGLSNQQHNHQHQQQLEQQYHQQQQQNYFEHEYHQPQELQLQLKSHQSQQHAVTTTPTAAATSQPLYHSQSHPQQLHPSHTQQQQQQQHNHHHQHQHSASMSSTSTTSMPSLSCMPLQRQIPEQMHLQSSSQPQHVLHLQHAHHQQQHPHHPVLQYHQQQQQQKQQQQHHHELESDHEHEELAMQQREHSPDLHHDNLFHWPTATSLVTS